MSHWLRLILTFAMVLVVLLIVIWTVNDPVDQALVVASIALAGTFGLLLDRL